MTSLNKLAALVEQLAAKAEKDEIEWSEEYSDSFMTKIGTIEVAVARHDSPYDPEADPDYFLILRQLKRTVDTVSDSELQKYMKASYTTMRNLYNNARRSARSVSDLVDELTAELDKKIE